MGSIDPEIVWDDVNAAHGLIQHVFGGQSEVICVNCFDLRCAGFVGDKDVGGRLRPFLRLSYPGTSGHKHAAPADC